MQASLAPGDEVRLVARLREYDVPPPNGATVWAEVGLPGGGSMSVNLKRVAPGDYAGRFRTTSAGVYPVRVRAHGETLRGSRFTREKTLTAVADSRGAEPPGIVGDGNSLAELLCCLLAGEGIRAEAFERLGIDPEAARRCIA